MYLDLASQKIHFIDQGEGDVIVLLHGFMESVFMWESLADRLSQNFRVLSIDLPGHGKSDDLKDDHSIDHMASLVHELLQKLGLRSVNLVGHSMGGYTALSFIEQFPSIVNSFTLLHSKAGDDSKEVKQRRKLGVKMLAKHPHFVVKESITNLFYSATRKVFLNEIEALVNEGQKASYQGYADALVAMMNRPDRSALLMSEIPKLYIAGKNDPVIPLELSEKEMSLQNNGEAYLLKKAGHMGFIEEKELCEETIFAFLQRMTKHQ